MQAHRHTRRLRTRRSAAHAVDKEDKCWEDKPSDYAAYYHDRMNRVLLGEDIDSLDPPLRLLLKTHHRWTLNSTSQTCS
jgi:hypothetical protein